MKKAILSALMVLASVSAHAFDQKSAYVESASVRFDGASSETGNCGFRSHNQLTGTLTIISYDAQVNKQEVKVPVVVRTRLVGLFCKNGENGGFTLSGVQGKPLSAIFGEYIGGRVEGALTTQVGLAVHFNSNGVILTDFPKLGLGLGFKLSEEKFFLATPDQTSNVQVNLIEAGKTTSTLNLPLKDAVDNISF